MKAYKGTMYYLYAIRPDGYETVVYVSPDDIKVYDALREREAWSKVFRSETRFEVRCIES